MKFKNDDLNISEIRPLLSPAVLMEEFPLSESDSQFVHQSRESIRHILNGQDKRLLVVAGPCSIHDPAAAVDYARQLQPVAERLKKQLFIVMRVYFEKPRTVMGWKGLINDPDLNESFQINKGLRAARKLLVDITRIGLPCGTEFLDTTFGQFYSDLISWAAIGARTVESQMHRQLASGLSMPVGIKNRTDGDIQVAVDALVASRHSHLFPSLTKEGAPALFFTTGNENGHLVLRGGTSSGPNYSSVYIKEAVKLLSDAGLPPVLMVDCSHGNSAKQPLQQINVVDDLIAQKQNGQTAIRGIMLESHLLGGRQNHDQGDLEYGRSITDACLSMEDTVQLLEKLAREF